MNVAERYFWKSILVKVTPDSSRINYCLHILESSRSLSVNIIIIDHYHYQSKHTALKHLKQNEAGFIYSAIMTDQNPSTTNDSWPLFSIVRFVSGVFLGVLAIATIVANIGLMVTLWNRRKRPLKTPTMYFVFGIAVADLTTGLVVEPAFSICYMSSDLSTCQTEIMELIQILPRLFVNSSFLLVLFLSWSHFLAVACPHFYKRSVTKLRVTVLVIGVFVYTTTFSFLQFSRISRHVLLVIDVFLHATFIPSLLMISYFAMLVSLRKHMRSRDAVLFRRRCAEVINGESESSINVQNFPYNAESVERQFIRMNLCLTVILLICTLPSIVTMHVALSSTDATFEQQTNLAVTQNIADDILFIKFALDPFIFAWNFSKIGGMWRSMLSRSSSPTITRRS